MAKKIAKASIKPKKKLEIKWVSIKKIQPASYNPRDISETAFEGLKESIKKFGVVDPFVINTRTDSMILVGGHQRLKACEALGHKEVPIVEVDLSKAEEKALNVTLNNQKIAGFYTDTLQDLIAEIQADLGDDFMTSLKLDELSLPDAWGDGQEAVDAIEGNLSGITTVIKVFCPQDKKTAVLDYLKTKLDELNIEGLSVI